MLTDGFVMLPRRIQEHSFWPRERFTKAEAFVDLYFQASIKRRQATSGSFFLERGNIEASVRFLSNRWAWSLHKTASFLHRLEIDKILVKKRNGSGNGYPSVYHIVDYDTYMVKASSEGNGHGNARDTVGKRSGYKTKKGENGKKNNTSSATAAGDFFSLFPPENQDLIRQAITAAGTTHKSGKLSPSGMNKLIGEFSKFPPRTVLKACQIYLDQNMACTGKGGKYLVGIMRQISKGEEASASQTKTQPIKTAGSLAIERVMAARKKEKNNDIPK
jgi:hypothetical protein